MVKSKKLQLEEIETRRALDTAIDDETDGAPERLTEARNALRNVSERLAAALEMEEAPAEEQDAETREYTEIEDRATVSGFVKGWTWTGAELEGAEKELTEALEMRSSGTAVQIANPAFGQGYREEGGCSYGALAVDTVTKPAPWLTRLFSTAQSWGTWALRPNSVPTGVASYPVITGGTTASDGCQGCLCGCFENDGDSGRAETSAQ